MALQLWRIITLPFIPLSLPDPSAIKSRTVLITGANTGLGLEAARHICNMGAKRIILGVRTPSKGETAKADILRTTTTSLKPQIDVWEVDLESFDSVRRFTEKANKLERLDIAIMNAGIATGKYKQTLDGWESMVQVNVLSTALMGLLLLPKLVEARKANPEWTPHLCFVSSEAHEHTSFKERYGAESLLDALNDKSKMVDGDVDRYYLTKLLLMYIVAELSDLVSKTSNATSRPAVVVNSLAPGFCKSALIKDDVLVLQILQALFARTVEKGSKTLVYAAAAGVETHGKYLDHNTVARPGKLVTSEEGVELRERLWKEVIEVLVKTAPEVKTALKAIE